MITEWILPILWAALGALGFGFIFGTRGRKLLYTALGGGITWLVYLACIKLDTGEYFAYAVAAAVGTLYSEIMARALRTPVTVFVITVNIPLIPGGSLYYSFLYLMENDTVHFIEKVRYTLGTAGAIALGIFVSTMLFKIVHEINVLLSPKK